jgi:hypothetical protein
MNDSFKNNAVLDIAMAYQRRAALIAAVKLDIFTAIGAETASLDDLVARNSARGLRILCDYLTVIGLLEKRDSHYALTPIARTFLTNRLPSPWTKSLILSPRRRFLIFFSAIQPRMFGATARAD